jgi:anti-sigma B factor antagonist
VNITSKIELHPKGVVIISLKGKILTENCFDDISEKIESKIESGKKKFLLDLTDVSHMNSSGLNILLRLFTKIRTKGGELIMINPSKVVNQLFIISKLNTVFKIGANKEEALKQLIAQEA